MHLLDMSEPDPNLDAAPLDCAGRRGADELFQVTYQELKTLARRHRQRWRGNSTLGTTVLVHEAYQRLAGSPDLRGWERTHFLAVAARAMRQVLVNYAKMQSAEKRGGGIRAAPLDSVNPVAPEVADEVLALHQALEELGRAEPRRAQVVECRFFAGLSIEETAEALGVSPATVKRDWVLATAWLRRKILETPEGDAPSGREAVEG
jgi:RNA polymerase sigma factor (TIGR02999 family)